MWGHFGARGQIDTGPVRAALTGPAQLPVQGPCGPCIALLAGWCTFCCCEIFWTSGETVPFFSSSTSRWEVLKSFISRTVKRQCQTRWSSRYDAVEVMYDELDKTIASLDLLLEGDYFRDIKSGAGALLHSIQQFPFISLLNFWFPIFKSVDKVLKRLQDPKMEFNEAFCDLKSLIQI